MGMVRPIVFCRCLPAVFVLLLGLAQICPAADEPLVRIAPPQRDAAVLRYQRFFVAEEDLEREAKGMLPIKRAELDQMLRQQAPLTVLPPAAWLKTVEIEASLDPQGCLIGKFSAEVATSSQQPTPLNLGPSPLAWEKPLWEGASSSPAILGVRPLTGDLTLTVEKAGRFQADWSLRPQQKQATAATFVLEFPAAPVRSFRLQLPIAIRPSSQAGTVQPDSAVPAEKVPANVRLWRIDLPLTGSLDLTLSPADQGLQKLPLILAREASDLQISRSDFTLETTFTFDLPDQKCQQFEFQAPANLQIVSVRVDQQPVDLQTIRNPASDTLLYRCESPEPLVGKGHQLRIVGVAPPQALSRPGSAPGGMAATWLPRIRWNKATWLEGELRVSIDAGLELALDQLHHCRQTAATPPQGADKNEQLKFQLLAADAQLKVHLRPQAAPLTVRQGTLIAFDVSQITATVQAEVTPLRGETFQTEVWIPQRWIVDSLETNPAAALEDRLMLEPQGDWQRIAVRFRSPITSTKPLILVLRAHRPRSSETERVPENAVLAPHFPAALVTESYLAVHSLTPSVTPEVLAESRFRKLLATKLTPKETLLFEAVPVGDIYQLPPDQSLPIINLAVVEPHFSAETKILTEIDQARVRSECRIRCLPDGATVTRLLVRASVPPSADIAWELVGEPGESLAVTAVEQMGSGLKGVESPSGWLLELKRPKGVPFEVVAKFSQPVPKQFQVPLFSVAEATRQAGEVIVASESDWHLVTELEGASDLPTRSLPATTPLPLRGRYRYQPEKGDRIALKIDRKTAGLAAAQVRRLRLISRFDHNLGALHQAECLIENQGLEKLSFFLPPQATLLRIVDLENGKEVLSTIDPKRMVTMLVSPARKELSLRLIYQTADEPISRLGQAQLPSPAPQFTIPVLAGTWEVWLPNSVAIQGALASNTFWRTWWNERFLSFEPLGSRKFGQPIWQTSLAWLKSVAGPTAEEVVLQEEEQGWKAALAEVTLPGGPSWGEALLAFQRIRQKSVAPQEARPLLVDSQALAREGIWATSPLLVQKPATDLPPLSVGADPSVQAAELLAEAKLSWVVSSKGLLLTTQTEAALLAEPAQWKSRRGFVLQLPTISQFEAAGPEIAASSLLTLDEWQSSTPAMGSEPPLRSREPVWEGRESHLACRLPLAGGATPPLALIQGGVQGSQALACFLVMLATRWWLKSRLGLRVWWVTALLVVLVATLPLGVVSLAAGAFWGWLAGWILIPQAPRGQLGPANSVVTLQRSGASLRPVVATSVVVVFFLTLGGAPSPAQEEGSKTPPAAPFAVDAKAAPVEKIVIPIDAQELPTGDYAYVSPAFYQRLQNPPTISTGGDWVLRESHYAATLPVAPLLIKPAPLEFSVILQIGVARDQTVVTLPFQRKQLALLAGKTLVDGLPQAVEWDETGTGLLLARLDAGEHKIELRFFTTPLIDEKKGSVEFAMPKAASSTLVLTQADPAQTFQVLAHEGRHTAGASPLQTVVRLATSGKFHLEWQAAPGLTAARLRTSADQLLHWRLAPEHAFVDATWLVRPFDQLIQEVQVRLAPGLRYLPSSDQTAIETVWVETDVAQRQEIIHFKLTQAATRQTVLQATFAVEETTLLGEYSLPALQIVTDELQTCLTGISCEEPLELDDSREAAGVPLAPAQFVTALGHSPAATVIAAFDQTQNPFPLRLHIREKSQPLQVSTETRLRFGLERTEVRYDLRLQQVIPQHFADEIHFSLPLSIEQVELTEGGKSVPFRWFQMEDKLLLMRFQPPAAQQAIVVKASLPVAAEGEVRVPLAEVSGGRRQATVVHCFRSEQSQLTLIPPEVLVPLGEARPELSSEEWGRHVASYQLAAAPLGSPELPPVQPLVAKVQKNVPEWSVTQWTALSVEKNEWQATIDLQVNVTSGLLDGINLQLPPNLPPPYEWLDPAGDSAAASITVVGDGIQYHPNVPLLGQHHLRLRAGIKTAKGEVIRIPKVEVTGPQQLIHYLVLPKFAGNQPIAWQTTGAQPSDVPAGILGTPFEGKNATVWQVISPRFDAEVRRETSTAATPTLRLAHYDLANDAPNKVTCEATFWMNPAGLAFGTLIVPEGLQLRSLLVDQLPVEAEAMATGKWRFPLGFSQLPREVRGIFEGDAVPTVSQPSGDKSWAVPTLAEVKAEKITWSLRQSGVTQPAQEAGATPSALWLKGMFVKAETILALVEEMTAGASTDQTEQLLGDWSIPFLGHVDEWLGEVGHALRLSSNELATERSQLRALRQRYAMLQERFYADLRLTESRGLNLGVAGKKSSGLRGSSVTYGSSTSPLQIPFASVASTSRGSGRMAFGTWWILGGILLLAMLVWRWSGKLCESSWGKRLLVGEGSLKLLLLGGFWFCLGPWGWLGLAPIFAWLLPLWLALRSWSKRPVSL